MNHKEVHLLAVSESNYCVWLEVGGGNRKNFDKVTQHYIRCLILLSVAPIPLVVAQLGEGGESYQDSNLVCSASLKESTCRQARFWSPLLKA